MLVRQLQIAALATFALGMAGVLDANAQSLVEFPAGKPVSVYAGASAGGTVDNTMRTVARYIGKHLPANPTVVPKNMPGAGSRQLAAYLYNQATKDGTEFGLLLRPIATDSLFTDSKGQFDVLKLTWLGSPSPVTDVCGFWHTAPMKTLDALQRVEMIVPGIGADAGEVAQANILHNLTGAKIKAVIGYPGGGEMTLALERGEAHGRCALSWEAIKSTYPDFIAQKKFLPFVQFASARHAELSEVPAVMEFSRSDLDRRALEVFLAPQEFGFPFAAPPDLTPSVKALLRKAFAATLRDPGFLAEAEKRKFEVKFVPGEQLEAILERVYGYPPEVAEHAKALIARQR